MATNDTEILRFGDWYQVQKYNYCTPVEYCTPVQVYQSGSTQLTFDRRMVNVITVDNMEELLKAYDKYLDGRLVL
jgi:hypothetical protein